MHLLFILLARFILTYSKPDICIHSAKCFKGLPEVFDPKKRPWINAEGATTERIIEQVKICPSGALSFFMNAEKTNED